MYVKVVLVISLTIGVWSAPDSVQWYDLQPALPHWKVKAPTDFSPYLETWKEFKAVHARIYSNRETEVYRHGVFNETLRRIEEHNKKYLRNETSFYMGINQFSDLTREEFAKYHGLRFDRQTAQQSGCSQFKAPINTQAPTSVDWRLKGYVTQVKDQGQCGSCWSFSTTGSLEGQHFRKTGKLVSLSEQQLIDCSVDILNKGCNGGVMDQAFMYIKKAGGIEAEEGYPYKAQQEKCHTDTSLFAANVTGCQIVSLGDETALMKGVAEVGPISVSIDASHASFQSYAGGIYDEPQCSSFFLVLDHAVLVVGYGTDQGRDYWIVKNSWGSSWGDKGYIKMSRNKGNQCGIATHTVYPLV